MAESNFYKAAVLLTSTKFQWRVSMAMIQYANANVVQATGNAKLLATWVLTNPMVRELSMEAIIAADNTLINKVTINPNGPTDGDEITDAEISTIVQQKWNIVAAKYSAGVPAAVAGGATA